MTARINFVIRVFEKELLQKIRYPLNTLLGIVSWWIIFLLLFLGIDTFGASLVAQKTQVEGLIKGYLFWFLIMANLQEVSSFVSDETKAGTIEFLFVQPIGVKNIVWTRIVSQFIIVALELSLVITAISLTLNVPLKIDALYFLVIFVSMFSVWGWALLFGGIALLVQKIDSLVSIVTIAFSLIAVLPAETAPFKIYLPFANGTDLVKMIDAQSYTLAMLACDIRFIRQISISVVTFALGWLVWDICLRTAAKRGCLGHY